MKKRKYQCINSDCNHQFKSKLQCLQHEQTCFLGKSSKRSSNEQAQNLVKEINKIEDDRNIEMECTDSSGIENQDLNELISNERDIINSEEAVHDELDDDEDDMNGFDNNNNNFGNNDDFDYNNDFDNNDNFMRIACSIKDLSNSLPDQVRANLRLFYQHRATLSSFDQAGNDKVSSGMNIYIPSGFPGRCITNEVKNAHKKVVYRLSKLCNFCNTLSIESGPYWIKDKLVYHSCTITLRSISSLLLTIFNDVEIMSVGEYKVKPTPLSSNLFAASYNQSPHYHKRYSEIISRFGDTAIPVPLLLWMDSGTFMDFNNNGKAHAVMLMPLLLSPVQLTAYNRSTRLVALTVEEDLDGSVPSIFKAYLRSSLKGKVMKLVLEQINEIEKTGLPSSQGLLVPFISIMTADMIEMRSVLGSSNCPLCNDLSNLGSESDACFDEEYSDQGIRLTSTEKKEVIEFEQFQASLKGKMITEDDINRLKQFQKIIITRSNNKIQRKLLSTAFDDTDILVFVDKLHAVVLNELKKFIEFLYSSMNKECISSIEVAIKEWSNFPRGIFQASISGMTATQISKGALLLILILYSSTIPCGFKNRKVMKEHIEVLESLVLLFCITSKDVISLEEKDGNVSDKIIIDDVVMLLRSSNYFSNSKRINVHYLLFHFCNTNMWRYLCSPKFASSAYGEHGLSYIKRALRASSKKSNWRQHIIQRTAIAELFLPLSSQDQVYDFKVKPSYKKVCKLWKGQLSIGYIDAARGNMFYSANVVKFESYKDNAKHYTIAARKFNNHILITDIMNEMENEEFQDIMQSKIVIKGYVLKDATPDILQKIDATERGEPHGALFNYLMKGEYDEWRVDDIIGGCYLKKLQEGNILCIQNHEYSNYVTDNFSIVIEPDRRTHHHIQ